MADASRFLPLSARWTSGSPAESQTSKAERTLRRFWKTVNLESDPKDGSWLIKLDKRTLKTPSGLPLALPKEKLAAALVIAHEWDSQTQLLKPHSLPLVSPRFPRRLAIPGASSRSSASSTCLPFPRHPWPRAPSKASQTMRPGHRSSASSHAIFTLTQSGGSTVMS